MPTKVASLYAEIGAQTQGFEAGAAKVKGGLSSLAGMLPGSIAQFATLTGAVLTVGGALKNAFDYSQKYAQQVRDLSLISGTGAEETSKFIQVLDDYQLSAEDATLATKKLKDQGLVPSIDTLAKLADEYKKIQDPAQKMVFIQENLGRGGAKWVNVLNQSSDALRANAAQTDKNLILSDKQIANAEKERLAIDALSDTYNGWKIKVGSAIGEVIVNEERWITALDQARSANENAAPAIQEFAAAALIQKENAMAAADAIHAHADALDGILPPAAAATEAIATLFDNQFLSTINSQSDATRTYNATLEQLGQELRDRKINHEQFAQGIEDAANAYTDAGNKIIFSLIQMSLAADGWQASDTAAILSAGVALGQFNQQQANTAASTIANAEAMAQAHANMAANVAAQTPTALAALGALDQELMTGKITSEDYKGAVQGLYQAIRRLDGSHAVANIEVIITTTGGDLGVISHTASIGNQKVTRRAGGGPIPAFGTSSVVENGSPEVLTVGNKSWVMMGNQGGQVTALDKASGKSGGSSGGMSEADYRTIAKMFAAELHKVMA